MGWTEEDLKELEEPEFWDLAHAEPLDRGGAGRHPRVTVTLTRDELSALTHAAGRMNMTVSEFIRSSSLERAASLGSAT